MRIYFLFLATILAVTNLFSQDKKPNVLFILADDLGVNALHCYGNEKVESPNIDKLFTEGMHFTNGYSSDPTCAPSRASIMTGQYVSRHQLYRVSDRYKKNKKWLQNMKYLPPESLRPTGKQVSIDPGKSTIAKTFQENGYSTAAFGKCHFGSKDLSFAAHGFDESVETTKHYNFKSYPSQDDILENEYNADYTTRKGIDFMKRKVASEEPFFLYMPYYLVHKPLEPKAKYLKHFKEKYGDELNEEILKVLAMIKSLDESVGQLLKAVEELGIEEETIIIFTSDNGHYKIKDNFFNQPYRMHKGSTYEGGIRVPYIFKWKNKIVANSVSAEPIIHIDLYPTLLGLTQSQSPIDHTLDGENLSPILLGQKNETEREALVWQYTNYAGYKTKDKTWRSSWVNVIQSDGFKLTEQVETGDYLLYNLNKDPFEKNEIAGEMPEKVASLKILLDAWKKNTDSALPRENPDYMKSQ